jgi:hypothetical protein
MRMWMMLVLLSLVTALPARVSAETMITAPGLVNKAPGLDFHIGTDDDVSTGSTIGVHQSGANVRGTTSYLLMKSGGAIPTDGTDFEYIIFFDGSMDLSVDLAASTANTMVLNVVGGTLATTPEGNFATGGTLTGLSGTVTFSLTDGSATATFNAQFDDTGRGYHTSAMNQALTAAPGSSLVVLHPSFGNSGNAYVDQVLTPIVSSNADEIVLIEFTGTTTGIADTSCCTAFGVRGVFALYRTATGSVTTTTIPGAGACTNVQSCGAALDGALPSAGSTDRKVRKTAGMLRRIATAAKAKLAKAASASGKKQTRLYKMARMKLTMLLSQTRKADAKSRLGVPLATLESAIQALLALIPAT